VISVENSKFFPPHVLFVPTEMVPFGIGYRRLGSKNQNDGATGPSMMFDGVVTMQQRDRRTDRHQTTANTALTHSERHAVKTGLSATILPNKCKNCSLSTTYNGEMTY